VKDNYQRRLTLGHGGHDLSGMHGVTDSKPLRFGQLACGREDRLRAINRRGASTSCYVRERTEAGRNDPMQYDSFEQSRIHDIVPQVFRGYERYLAKV
jgi:hypothetical protein